MDKEQLKQGVIEGEIERYNKLNDFVDRFNEDYTADQKDDVMKQVVLCVMTEVSKIEEWLENEGVIFE